MFRQRCLGFRITGFCQAGPRGRTGPIRRHDGPGRSEFGSPLALVLLLRWLAWIAVLPAIAAEHDLGVPTVSLDDAGYSVTRWSVEDGLPTQTVFSLAQTPDGRLWIATQNGLVRFNGYEFRVYYAEDTPGLKGDRHSQLWLDSRGRLWIYGNMGNRCFFSNGTFHPAAKEVRLPGDLSDQFAEDAKGNIWIMSGWDGRLFRMGGEQSAFVAEPHRQGWPNPGCQSLISDPTGQLWGTGDSMHPLFTVTSEGLRDETVLNEKGQLEPELSELFRLPDGKPALVGRFGIYALEGSAWKTRRTFSPLLPASARPRETCRDPFGNIWIGTYAHGLFLCKPDGQLLRVPLPREPNESAIRDLLTDAEGNVWIAAVRGLYRIRPTAFRVPAGAGSLAGFRVAVITQDDAERMWFLTVRGLARYLPDRALDLVDPKLPFSIHYIAPGPRGTVWMAGDSEVYEWSTDGLKRFGEFGTSDKSTFIVRGLLQTRSNELWAATTQGAFRWNGSEFVREYDAGMTALAEDLQGRVYGAMIDGGIVRRDIGGWQVILRGEQRRNLDIIGFCVDSDNTVWVAGRSPVLARWREGRWFEFPPDRSILPRKVLAIALDPYGGLWLTTPDRGAVRLDRQSLNAWAEGKATSIPFTWFDHQDGLPSDACSFRTGICQTREGNIWVGTARGAAVIDVRQWQRRQNRLPPPRINIETILINDREVTTPELGGTAGSPDAYSVVVPPGYQRIEFRYAAIHLQAPQKNRYQYRLEGLDTDWVEVGSQRSAHYTHLPPGSYRFHVTASDGFGHWNREGAMVHLTVLPAWWQTASFRIGMGMLVLGLLWLGGSLKLRQLRRERLRREDFSRRLIESQEAERRRLAGELHDDLGQDLLVIKSRLDTARMDVEKGGQHGLNSELAGSVSHLIRKVRDISHALRPLQLERLGLSACVRSMVKEVSEATGIHVETDIDDCRGHLSSAAEIGLYRILQEAMNNVVKHSDASEVRVALKRGSDHVILSVEDDGRGFPLKRLEELGGSMGHGLDGMAERCRLMGGRFQVFSSPGNGTLIRGEVPLGEGTTITAAP